MVTHINWASPLTQFTGAQRVYVRQRWAADYNADTEEWTDSPWIRVPGLHCESANWSLLPTIPSAQLVYEYGHILDSPERFYTNRGKLQLAGWYVKIEFDAPDGTFSWYGFVDEVADQQGGRSAAVPTGQQSFVAYGLVQILAHHYLTSSRWHDEPNGVYRDSGSSIDFNAAGRPNRSADVVDDEDEPFYVFAPQTQKTASNAQPWAKSEFWSSKEICRHLIQYSTPRDSQGLLRVPFALEGADYIPDWDKPTVNTEGRTVLSVLNELVNPSRMLQISTSIDESVLPHRVVLNIHSLASTPIGIPQGTHDANPSKIAITVSDSPDTTAVVQSSETERVHQVIVKGAKREVCYTFDICSSANSTEHGLIEGFDGLDIVAYNLGAIDEPAYAQATDEDRQRMNAAARGKASLSDVYRTFVLNPAWDSWNEVFTVGDDPAPGGIPAEQYHPYWGSITVARYLPLKENVDYTQPVVNDDAESEYRSPYVLFKDPEVQNGLLGTFHVAERIADGANFNWSVSVGIGKYGQAVQLDVEGEQQHAIAKTHFIPTSVDYGDLGDYDYLDAKLTLSVTDDRFSEVRYPETVPDRDVLRTKVIYAGPAYRQVLFRAPFVDVDASGEPQFIDDTFVVNDKDKLEAIATLAAAWHGLPRNVLRIQSARPSAQVAVGQLVTAINPETPHATTVGTVVSEVSYSTPRAEGFPQPPTFRLTTAAGELDPLQFAPEPDPQ